MNPGYHVFLAELLLSYTLIWTRSAVEKVAQCMYEHPRVFRHLWRASRGNFPQQGKMFATVVCMRINLKNTTCSLSICTTTWHYQSQVNQEPLDLFSVKSNITDLMFSAIMTHTPFSKSALLLRCWCLIWCNIPSYFVHKVCLQMGLTLWPAAIEFYCPSCLNVTKEIWWYLTTSRQDEKTHSLTYNQEMSSVLILHALFSNVPTIIQIVVM